MAGGKKKVGVVGYGALGQFLVGKLLADTAALAAFELVFVWNRTAAAMAGAVPAGIVLDSLDDFEARGAELIVEVAHPSSSQTHARRFADAADLFVGSPTVFADAAVGGALLDHARSPGAKHSIFIPSGALWGVDDIVKMAERQTLTALTISMRKPSQSFRLEEPLQALLAAFEAEGPGGAASVELYRGPVRGICPLAPNNVNTMAAAAIASGAGLGFDRCEAVLTADRASAAHEITVTVTGKAPAGRDDPFTCSSTRYNPCDPKAVTASATYPSFYSSLVKTTMLQGMPGVHFC
jgi:predicted dinucleotide-utilizing enzyme